MQLKQLSYFAAVVECGSISRAAEDLYLAQSSLSQSILSLEKELGFKLLNRSRAGVTLTGMGELVYDGAKELLAHAERLNESWAQIYQERCTLNGTVRIATVPGVYPILISRFLPRLREACPNVRYKLLEARSPLLLSYLAQDQTDLALIDLIQTDLPAARAACQQQGLELLELCPDSYKIAVGSGRPLAGQEELSREDAAGLSLACYSGGDAAAQLYFSHSFDRNLSVEYNSIEKMVQEAIQGPGVSVLPELTIRCTYPDALRFLTVEGFCVPFVHCVGFRQGARERREIEITLQMLQKDFSDELK